MTSKNLPQRRRPHHTLHLQCRPASGHDLLGYVLSDTKKATSCASRHLCNDEMSGTRKAARNALQICWRSPLQIALTAGCCASRWKLGIPYPISSISNLPACLDRYNKKCDCDCMNTHLVDVCDLYMICKGMIRWRSIAQY